MCRVYVRSGSCIVDFVSFLVWHYQNKRKKRFALLSLYFAVVLVSVISNSYSWCHGWISVL